MADEFFYGVTLKGAKSEVLWNPDSGAEDLEYPRANKLIIKQILLGVEAKENEYNVVEVETKSEDKVIKIPIAVLKVGESRCSQSFLEFPDAVKFTLIQGEGPVHIHGHHLVGDVDGEEMDEELLEADEEDLDEAEEDVEDEPKAKKSKLGNQNSKGPKNDKNNKKK